MLSTRPPTMVQKTRGGESARRSLEEEKREALKNFKAGQRVNDGRIEGIFVKGNMLTGEAIVRFGRIEKKMSPLVLQTS